MLFRSRKDTPIEQAFAGDPNVTHADITDLYALGVDTVGVFASVASDGDLTDNGFPAEQSIRLTLAFEKCPFRDLLDYSAELEAVTKAEEKLSAKVPARVRFTIFGLPVKF